MIFSDSEVALRHDSRVSLRPEQLRRFFEVWNSARHAYQAILATGVIQDDIALSRDHNYKQLLADGIKLRAMGGEGAVYAAIMALANTCDEGCAEHFFYLWDGLTPSRTQ